MSVAPLRVRLACAIADLTEADRTRLFERSTSTDDAVRSTVARILSEVRTGGDDALRDLARTYDRVTLDALEVPVRAGLRLGVQQLLTGVPAHAAVGETVEAIGRVRPKAKGFANGVLRSVARLGPDWPWPEGDDDEAVAVRTSHPAWIVRRLRGLEQRVAARALDPEALALHGREMGAARDEGHVRARMRQSGAEPAADAARA